MFGSDWPISTLACAYGDTLSVAGDDPDVLARTAVRVYRLQLP